jgi:hypothetical protein
VGGRGGSLEALSSAVHYLLKTYFIYHYLLKTCFI